MAENVSAGSAEVAHNLSEADNGDRARENIQGNDQIAGGG